MLIRFTIFKTFGCSPLDYLILVFHHPFLLGQRIFPFLRTGSAMELCWSLTTSRVSPVCVPGSEVLPGFWPKLFSLFTLARHNYFEP